MNLVGNVKPFTETVTDLKKGEISKTDVERKQYARIGKAGCKLGAKTLVGSTAFAAAAIPLTLRAVLGVDVKSKLPKFLSNGLTKLGNTKIMKSLSTKVKTFGPEVMDILSGAAKKHPLAVAGLGLLSIASSVFAIHNAFSYGKEVGKAQQECSDTIEIAADKKAE